MKESLLSALKKNHEIVHVEHFRMSKTANTCLPLRYFRINGTQHDINPKGGLTMISVKTKDGNRFSVASRCHSKDAYKNRLGVHMCAQKILEAIENHKLLNKLSQV